MKRVIFLELVEKSTSNIWILIKAVIYSTNI